MSSVTPDIISSITRTRTQSRTRTHTHSLNTRTYKYAQIHDFPWPPRVCAAESARALVTQLITVRCGSHHHYHHHHLRSCADYAPPAKERESSSRNTRTPVAATCKRIGSDSDEIKAGELSYALEHALDKYKYQSNSLIFCGECVCVGGRWAPICGTTLPSRRFTLLRCIGSLLRLPVYFFCVAGLR